MHDAVLLLLRWLDEESGPATVACGRSSLGRYSETFQVPSHCVCARKVRTGYHHTPSIHPYSCNANHTDESIALWCPGSRNASIPRRLDGSVGPCSFRNGPVSRHCRSNGKTTCRGCGRPIIVQHKQTNKTTTSSYHNGRLQMPCSTVPLLPPPWTDLTITTSWRRTSDIP